MKPQIVIISVFCLATVALFSCTRHSLKEDKGTFVGEGVDSPYFFTNILKVKGMEVGASADYGYGLGKSERTSLHVGLYGDMYDQHREATSTEFEKLANAIGDVPKKEKYCHGTPVDNQTTESSISSVSVKTLTGYDETHPQGSLLKDIIRLRFQSFDHVFDKTLKPTKFGSADHAYYVIEPDEAFSLIKYPALLGRGYGGKEYVGGLVMSIEFTQKPTNPSQHIEVTLCFANGLVLSKEVSVQIKEQ